MPIVRKGAIPGLAIAGVACLLVAVLFPHPDFEDLHFTSGLLADVQNPKKKRHSYLLEIVDDSEHSPTLAIPVNNNQADWDRISNLLGRVNRSRPIEVWFFDIWFLNFPPEVWHLEQNGKVILDYGLKDYEYRFTRKLIGAIGGVLLLTSVLLIYRRSRREPVSSG